jgi:serine/threonine protein kinase
VHVLNSKNQIVIVTELASRGDLSRCLDDITSVVKRVKVVQDLLTGMAWLQVYSIVHRDLKLQNLLVATDWTIKVSDFGLSINLTDGLSHQFGGNVKYSAPEILSRRFSENSDDSPFPYSEKN